MKVCGQQAVDSTLSDDISKLISRSECTMVAGGVAGCVGKTITAPLSRLTILLQVGSLSQSMVSNMGSATGNAKIPSGLYHATKQVFTEEGILSFWKGNMTSVIHRFPYSAINFTVYDELQMVSRKLNVHETPMTRFISGSIAGGVACFACYPLDLVRTQLTVLKTPLINKLNYQRKSFFGSISSIIQTIVEQEGIRGLYRGLLISLAVTIPTFGISFCVYGTIKEKLLNQSIGNEFNYFKDPISGHLNAYGSMFSGAMSGIISSILLFPADSIRRRIQVEKVINHNFENMNNDLNNHNVNNNTSNVSTTTIHNDNNINNGSSSSSNNNNNDNNNHNNNPKNIKNSGAINEVFRVMRAYGFKGLYRGLVPELLKVTPMVSITFCVYEYTYNLLNSRYSLD